MTFDQGAKLAVLKQRGDGVADFFEQHRVVRDSEGEPAAVCQQIDSQLGDGEADSHRDSGKHQRKRQAVTKHSVDASGMKREIELLIVGITADPVRRQVGFELMCVRRTPQRPNGQCREVDVVGDHCETFHDHKSRRGLKIDRRSLKAQVAGGQAGESGEDHVEPARLQTRRKILLGHDNHLATTVELGTQRIGKVAFQPDDLAGGIEHGEVRFGGIGRQNKHVVRPHEVADQQAGQKNKHTHAVTIEPCDGRLHPCATPARRQQSAVVRLGNDAGR